MRKVFFWIIALLITFFTAIYQRQSGPTYPRKGKIVLAGEEISYFLPRSHESNKNCLLKISTTNQEIKGELIFKRYKTEDPWTKITMTRKGNSLEGYLPHQPPAGKLIYWVFLTFGDEEVSLPGKEPLIIRFKGHVPLFALLPHVVIIFAAMLFSTRAGLEALVSQGRPRKYALWTLILLFVGGMIFGPLVQKFAFNTWWTGFPFGHDLTDNKTLLAILGWAFAIFMGSKKKSSHWWFIYASIFQLVVFLIPHSLLGSELDYSKINLPQG